MLQQTIVALVVAAAFAYSAWALMPAAWRSGLRRRLGWVAPVTAGGCGGCGGGCAAPARPAPAMAVVTLHRRPPAPGAATPRPDGSADATAA